MKICLECEEEKYFVRVCNIHRIGKYKYYIYYVSRNRTSHTIIIYILRYISVSKIFVTFFTTMDVQ